MFLLGGFSWLQKRELWKAPSGLVALPAELLKALGQLNTSMLARSRAARVGQDVEPGSGDSLEDSSWLVTQWG